MTNESNMVFGEPTSIESNDPQGHANFFKEEDFEMWRWVLQNLTPETRTHYTNEGSGEKVFEVEELFTKQPETHRSATWHLMEPLQKATCAQLASLITVLSAEEGQLPVAGETPFPLWKQDLLVEATSRLIAKREVAEAQVEGEFFVSTVPV